MQETWVWSLVGKIPWRRKWQSTSVFLPGKLQGQRSLVGCSPWSCKESDMTEHACTLEQGRWSINVVSFKKKKEKLCFRKWFHFHLSNHVSPSQSQAQVETGNDTCLSSQSGAWKQAELCECRNSHTAKLCLIRAVRLVNPKYWGSSRKGEISIFFDYWLATA